MSMSKREKTIITDCVFGFLLLAFGISAGGLSGLLVAIAIIAIIVAVSVIRARRARNTTELPAMPPGLEL